METTAGIQRIRLAAEHPNLLAFARAFLEHTLPGVEIQETELDLFLDLLHQDADADELLTVVLQADADGHLSPGSPLVQQLMGSRTPVLVLRAPAGEQSPAPGLERIVVPLDGSSRAGQAVPVAERIAGMINLPVRFVMVIDPSRVIPAAFAYDPDAWGIIEELRQTAHWALSQAEQRVRAAGIEVGSDLLYGPINASLLTSVQEGDLVIMTTQGLGRSGRRNADSVALRVLCSVSQPILLMRAVRQADVIVDGYEACSWVEPLTRNQVWKA